MAGLSLTARDPITSEPSRVTSSGATPSAPQQVLFGDSFHGSTLDEAARWTKVTATGGAVTVGDGQAQLSTSAASGGSALIKSIPLFALYSGSEILFTTIMKMTNAPATGNSRFAGLRLGASNHFYFALTDSSWQAAVTYGGGGLESFDISSPRADALNFMKLQIRLTKTRIQFIANDTQVHVYDTTGKQAPLNFGSLVQAWAENTNGASTTDNLMTLAEISVVRSFETWPSGATLAKRIAASTLIARGPCWYLGHKKVSGTNAVTIYDNTAASGTIVDEWTGVTYDEIPPGPIECQNGIYANYASGTDPSIIYYALA